MDWAPVPALRELRRIVNVMDRASKQILSDTKRQVQSQRGVEYGEEARERFDGRGKGKDVLSIMRMCVV